ASADAHGAPLGPAEVELTKANLNWDHQKDFHVPEDVKKHFEDIISHKIQDEDAWKKKYEIYQNKYPQLAKQWEVFHNKKLDEKIFKDDNLHEFSKELLSTRAASGELLNKLALKIPNLIGGSADLAPS